MEKINWKEELKRTGKEMLDAAYSALCVAVVCAGILYFQTDENITAIKIIMQPKNFSMVSLIFTGIALWAMIFRLIINYTFKFMMFLIRIIIRTNI